MEYDLEGVLEGIDLNLPQVQINERIIQRTGEDVVEQTRQLTFAGMMGPRFRNPSWLSFSEEEKNRLLEEAKALADAEAGVAERLTAVDPFFQLDKVLIQAYGDHYETFDYSYQPTMNKLTREEWNSRKRYLRSIAERQNQSHDFEYGRVKSRLSGNIEIARRVLRDTESRFRYYHDNAEDSLGFQLLITRRDWECVGIGGILADLGCITFVGYLEKIDELVRGENKIGTELPMSTKVPGVYASIELHARSSQNGDNIVYLTFDKEAVSRMFNCPYYLLKIRNY